MATLIAQDGTFYAQFYSRHRTPPRKKVPLRTRARRLAERGVPIEVIRQYAGHASVVVTDRYCRLRSEWSPWPTTCYGRLGDALGP